MGRVVDMVCRSRPRQMHSRASFGGNSEVVMAKALGFYFRALRSGTIGGEVWQRVAGNPPSPPFFKGGEQGGAAHVIRPNPHIQVLFDHGVQLKPETRARTLTIRGIGRFHGPSFLRDASHAASIARKFTSNSGTWI